MVIEKLLEKTLNNTPRLIKHIYTLFLIIFSRSIFYFVDFKQLKFFLEKLFNIQTPIKESFYTDIYAHFFWFILVVVLCIPWDEIFSKEHKINMATQSIFKIVQPVINFIFLALSIALLVDSSYNPFIYFRF